MSLPASPIVGIDLGTTNSLVAFCDSQGPRILRDSDGQTLVPSVVRFDVGGTTVGRAARDAAHDHPERTISSIKRLMGRALRDAQADLPYLPFTVVAGENNTARVSIPTHSPTDSQPRIVSPQEVSAVILRALKDQASAALNTPVSRAVITVPAYFDDAQRQATKDAGRLAGLEVVRIVNEPTAAALAYGLGANLSGESSAERIIAVYDLGGGTFDISILRITPAHAENETSFFEVLATAGDTHLGGDDADHELMQLLFGGDPQSLSLSDRRILKREAEAIKIRLSEFEAAQADFQLSSGPIKALITRDQYEARIIPLIERTLESCRRALADAARTLKQSSSPPIERVIMVGGMTRTPLVRKRVGEFFKLEPYIAVDPDQVVALGASVQASILSGETKGALLLDVIPLSLGIETIGGAVAKLIIRNSTVPAKAREFFSTSIDNQTSIRLSVFQGEREMAADCRRLGEFHLRGIPPMPAGIPQLEVEFLVDSSGVLNVSAAERRSGKRAMLQVIPNHGLTRDEVDRMERESYLHAREDMTRHRIVDLIANSSLDLKWIGERFEKYKHILEADNRVDLQNRIEDLRQYVDRAKADWKSIDPDTFHKAKEALDKSSLRLQEVGIAMSLKESQPKI